MCWYCGQETEMVRGREIYPHRKDLANKKFMLCRPCMAYVGCHLGTGRPLGNVANAELREVRMRVHKAFDPIWKSGKMRRNQAYSWLSAETGIPKDRCHIGMMDADDCRRCLEVIECGCE